MGRMEDSLEDGDSNTLARLRDDQVKKKTVIQIL
jgi:hypothetical protein